MERAGIWPPIGIVAPITRRSDNIIPPETLCEPQVEEVSSSEDFSSIIGEVLDSMPEPPPNYSADLIRPPAPLLEPFTRTRARTHTKEAAAVPAITADFFT